MLTPPGTTANTTPSTLPAAVLALGVVLGLLADRLFTGAGPTGFGYFLWTLLFAAALGWLIHHFNRQKFAVVLGWSLIAVLAAALLLWRSTPLLALALLLVMAVAMAMIVLALGNRSLAETTLTEHCRALLIVPLQGVTGALPILSGLDLRAGFSGPGWWPLLRGALLAIPLLGLFGALFAAADARFASLLSGVDALISPLLFQHLVQSGILAWLITGLLASVAGNRLFVDRHRLQLLKLGTGDTAVLLGSLAALFLVFVVLQLEYLFGGWSTIESTPGLTLAQYARRGFFELLAVAGLTLSLLILVAGSGCNQRVFRPLAAVLLGCVLVIQVSAVQRLLLYVSGYGLTIDRVVALAVLAWLAVGLLLFAGTLLRGQTRLFAAGMTLSGVGVVFLLVLANPADLVARSHLSRAGTHYFVPDSSYLLGLGDDAVPALVRGPAQLTVTRHQCALLYHLYASWYDPGRPDWYGESDWRGWNYSRRRAAALIGSQEPGLRELAGNCLVNGQLLDLDGGLRSNLEVAGRPLNAFSLARWIGSAP